MKLLEILCDDAQSFDATKNEIMVIEESDIKIYLVFQGKLASINVFATLFRSRVDTIKVHGGEPGHHPAQEKRILEREM